MGNAQQSSSAKGQHDSMDNGKSQAAYSQSETDIDRASGRAP